MSRRPMMIALTALLLATPMACADAPSQSPSPSPKDPPDQGTQDLADSPDASRPDMSALDQDLQPGPDLGQDLGQDLGADMGQGTACPVGVASPGVAPTDRGPIRGVAQGQLWAFLGVPFAAPPTGPRRFQPPQPHECWGPMPRPADSPGAPCPQLSRDQPIGDEDCLTLNVWTRQGYSPTARRPVMVFIHGGGNIQGSASQTLPGGALLYDGALVANAHDVVVVTLQYRLGPLGYLALPELSAESTLKASGHYGTLDQIAALKWIKANIQALGGDPQRVMIFGESAGAVNTCTLVASPLARGLFHAALMQSAACTSTPLALAERAGDQAMAFTPCADAQDRVACLRALDAGDLVRAIPGSVSFGVMPTGGRAISYGPVVDGHTLKAAPLLTIERSEHNKVPFVVGSNADELEDSALLPLRAETAQEYERIVRATLAPLGSQAAQRVLDAYPVSAYDTPQDALVQVFTDSIFTCNARRTARAFARGQQEPVYRYFFSRRAPTARGTNPANHGVELLYVFGSLANIPLYRPAAQDLTLSAQLMASWVSLATSGDPNTEALGLTWPPYVSAQDNQLILDSPLRMQDAVRADKCDLWDELVSR